MEHLDFILWMVLFPISMSLNDYILTKIRQITNEKQKIYSEKVEATHNLFLLFIWFFVGYLLF